MADKPKQDKAEDTATASAPEAEGAPTATATGEAPFVDDIIIWSEGLDSPRQLTHKALVALPKVDPSLLPPLNSLIKQGVTLAVIPTTSGIGANCYLVNLATLKKPDGDKP